MKVFEFVLGLGTFFFVVFGPVQAQNDVADIIFVNANVFTGSEASSTC
jgi:hypothetical protein